MSKNENGVKEKDGKVKIKDKNQLNLTGPYREKFLESQN